MSVHKGEIEADRIVKNLARNVLIRAMLDLGIPVRNNCLPPSGPSRPCLPREPIHLMTRRRFRRWKETVIDAGAWMFGQPHQNSLYSFSTVSTLLEIDDVRLRRALRNKLPAEEREILKRTVFTREAPEWRKKWCIEFLPVT